MQQPTLALKEFANHNITQILKDLAENILMVEPWGKGTAPSK